MTHLSLIFTSRSWSAPGHLLNQPGVPVPAPGSLLKSTQYDCYSDSKWLWVCIFVTGPYLHPLWAQETHTCRLSPSLTHQDTHTHWRGTWASFDSPSSYCMFPIEGIFKRNGRQNKTIVLLFSVFDRLELIPRLCVRFCMIAGPIWTTFVQRISILFIIQHQSWQMKTQVIGFAAFAAHPEVLWVHSARLHSQFYWALLQIQIWLLIGF